MNITIHIHQGAFKGDLVIYNTNHNEELMSAVEDLKSVLVASLTEVQNAKTLLESMRVLNEKIFNEVKRIFNQKDIVLPQELADLQVAINELAPIIAKSVAAQTEIDNLIPDEALVDPLV